MRVQRERAMAVLVFMGLGLVIGAVLALLFAPKRGEDVRNELSHSLNEILDSGREVTNKTLKNLQIDFGDLLKKVEERLS